ncbi:MAG: helix-turn-helix transcriptional regulator [Actinobacteria bacterium]|nr:MAG: helix-turn-helix transcriptional regulator [Actinomycetota bacterium]
MNDETTTTLNDVAKALSHPARVRIVELLSRQSECMGAEVFGELDLAQSTVSEHLRVLREAGVVRATPVGTRTVYCLVPGTLESFAEEVAALAATSPRCLGGPNT